MPTDYTPFVACLGGSVFLGACLGLFIMWIREV